MRSLLQTIVAIQNRKNPRHSILWYFGPFGYRQLWLTCWNQSSWGLPRFGVLMRRSHVRSPLYGPAKEWWTFTGRFLLPEFYKVGFRCRNFWASKVADSWGRCWPARGCGGPCQAGHFCRNVGRCPTKKSRKGRSYRGPQGVELTGPDTSFSWPI